jgi:hypothetical protein
MSPVDNSVVNNPPIGSTITGSFTFDPANAGGEGPDDAEEQEGDLLEGLRWGLNRLHCGQRLEARALGIIRGTGARAAVRHPRSIHPQDFPSDDAP